MNISIESTMTSISSVQFIDLSCLCFYFVVMHILDIVSAYDVVAVVRSQRFVLGHNGT